jgi:hypothetical protein
VKLRSAKVVVKWSTLVQVMSGKKTEPKPKPRFFLKTEPKTDRKRKDETVTALKSADSCHIDN